MLIISDVRPDQLGLRTDLVNEPPAMLTWRVLNKIPNVVAMAGLVLGGVYWITKRSDEVARAEVQGAPGPDAGDAP